MSQISRDEYIDETMPADYVAPQPPLVGERRMAPIMQVIPTARPPLLQLAPAATRVVTVAPAEAVRTAWFRGFEPDAVIAAAAGVVLLLIGLIAITRGGFDGPMSDPVVDVLGFNHTTTLGIIEIIIGGSLLVAGATISRAGALFLSSVLAIGAFVGAVQTESFRESLGLESAFAWLLVLVGLLVMASSLLMPRYYTRTTTVRNGTY